MSAEGQDSESEPDIQPARDVAARENNTAIVNWGHIDNMNLTARNLHIGGVTETHYSERARAPKRLINSTGDNAADEKRAKQDSSSSDSLIFVNSIKAFKNKKLHPEKMIYEGEKRSANGQFPVAVKILPYSGKAMCETRCLHSVDSHPNVIKIIDSDIHFQGDCECVFVAMELCTKETLYEYIVRQKESDFDSKLAIRHATQLISALQYIHSKDVAHQDLSPNIVLFSRDEKHPYGEVKISGFGRTVLHINRQPAGCSQCANSIDGTCGYMAPEVLNEEEISAKSDVFSLGVLLYFRLSNGQHPYGEDYWSWNSNISRGKEPSLDGLLIEDEETRKKVENILRKMLRHDHKLRPAASEVIKEWNQIDLPEGFVKTIGQPGQQEFHTKPVGGSSNEERVDEHQKKDEDSKDEKTTPASCILMFHNQKLSALTGYSEEEYQLQDITDLPTTISTLRYTAVLISRNVYVLTSTKHVFRLNLDDLASGWCRVQSTRYLHRFYPPAAVLNDKIYVCGGTDRDWNPRSAVSDTCEVYSEDAGWATICNMQRPRALNCVVPLEGFLYSIGGWGKHGYPSKSVERYDPVADSWTVIEPMNEVRCYATSAAFKGKIYVLGGENAWYEGMKTVECFDPAVGTWTLLPFQMTVERRDFFSAVVFNGKLHLLGGAGLENWMEILDIDEGNARKVDTGVGQLEINHKASFALN